MHTTKLKIEETLYPKEPRILVYFHDVTGGRRVDHDTADTDCASGANLAVHAPLRRLFAGKKQDR